MAHVEVAKLVSARKPLDGEGSLRCDQDTWLLGWHIGTEKFVQGLKHQRRAGLADSAEDVDTAAVAALQRLADAEIAVKGVGGFHALENGVSVVNHRPPPVFLHAILGSQRSGQVPVDPVMIDSRQRVRREPHLWEAPFPAGFPRP